MRINLGLLIVCMVLMASIPSRSQTDADAVGWDPQCCWDCYESESQVAAIALATILGIPTGVSGILRRRYSKLDASRRIYVLEGSTRPMPKGPEI